ncbi:hypothetical protein [Hyalangium versicolor]|uniref:hypothetical protein n=1 Tax=Hyalangium versicolor TaxID=2861190 RepID=UPI001CCAA847|nr:hypothetical protein [Hyalangium versicolor]
MAPCSRCGTFLCGDCVEVMDEQAWCADCVEWVRKNGAPSRVVRAIFVLSVVGIVAFPICLLVVPVAQGLVGGVGLMVTSRELRRIRRGEGPLRGLRQAKVARVLCAVNLLLMLLWFAAVLYGLYRRGT